MSLLSDWKFRELGNFGGSWLNKDRSMIDTRGAIEANNVEYSTGSVGTRYGFQDTPIFSSVDVVEMYNWLAPFSQINGIYEDNCLVTATDFQSGQLFVKAINLSGQGSNNSTMGGIMVHPSGGGSHQVGGATILTVGMNLFAAVSDLNQDAYAPAVAGRMFKDPASGEPTIQGVGALTGIDPGLCAAFPGPCMYAPAISISAGLYTTPGTHRFGYLIEYVTGFTTRVSPDNFTTAIPTVDTFAPMFVSAGTVKITLPFIANWAPVQMTGIVAISIVMTTTTNLNQYYVVPGSRTLNDGVAAVSIDVDISDADLSSKGVDATPYLYWLTRSANNSVLNPVSPFAVRHLVLWGDRIAYLANVPDNQGNLIDALYVSERNNYQAITMDQHILQLPGQKIITTMFRMGTVNYIVGPHEIWGVSDNGDVPVTWSAPGLVDGRHGTLAIHGVEVAPSGDRAWIADTVGLYLFTGGPILDLPISYYQTPDWHRINWDAACTLRIKDDSGARQVCISVALDGATKATHIMIFDYTYGLTPETVRYSLNFIRMDGGTLPQQPIGAIELVRNNLPDQGLNIGRVELWVALWGDNADTGNGAIPFLRHMSSADASPFRDRTWSIDSRWSGPPLPGRDMGLSVMQHHHGFHARLRGMGTITPVVWDVDAKNSFICRTCTLSETPDEDELFFADLLNELAYVTLETKVIDSYFRLAFLRWYHTPYVMQR
jgi:hypothetical protein